VLATHRQAASLKRSGHYPDGKQSQGPTRLLPTKSSDFLADSPDFLADSVEFLPNSAREAASEDPECRLFMSCTFLDTSAFRHSEYESYEAAVERERISPEPIEDLPFLELACTRIHRMT